MEGNHPWTEESMTASRPCPGCLAQESRPFCVVGGIQLRSCRSCATVFTASLPSASESYDYQSYYHDGNLAVPAFVEQRLQQIVATFDDRRRSNRWLDVGCGAGALMHAARSRGWDVMGTEVAAQPAERLRSEGLDVLLGDLPSLDLPGSAFDVVSLIEVLEHLPDPDAQLRACAAALRPGGALYLTTPHARGLSGRLLGDRWTIVAPPEHLQLYSVAGLRAALARLGLVESTLRTEGADPRALVAAVRPGRGPDSETPGGRVARAYRLNESLTAHRTGTMAKRVVNAMLSATRLGDALKLVAERPD